MAGASLAGRASPRNKRRLRPKCAGVVPSHLRRWYPDRARALPRRMVRSGRIDALAGLAQQVEQLPCKHQVVGSNPSAGTNTTFRLFPRSPPPGTGRPGWWLVRPNSLGMSKARVRLPEPFEPGNAHD